jgi:hypothetical protein
MREVREILAAINRAHQAADDLSRWTWDNVVGHDVVPRQLPQPVDSHLNTLQREIHEIRQLADHAFDRYSSGPSGRALAGMPLTQEEYYLCRAKGADFGTAREIGLIGFDDYECYRMLCYEDDAWRGYINVNLEPRDPESRRVGMRFGRSPEECKRRFLSPEQDAFFREHLPEVYKRFADD